jgi:hypothetical protein
VDAGSREVDPAGTVAAAAGAAGPVATGAAGPVATGAAADVPAGADAGAEGRTVRTERCAVLVVVIAAIP